MNLKYIYTINREFSILMFLMAYIGANIVFFDLRTLFVSSYMFIAHIMILLLFTNRERVEIEDETI